MIGAPTVIQVWHGARTRIRSCAATRVVGLYRTSFVMETFKLLIVALVSFVCEQSCISQMIKGALAHCGPQPNLK